MFKLSICLFYLLPCSFSLSLSSFLYFHFFFHIHFFYCFQAFSHIQNLCHYCFAYCAPSKSLSQLFFLLCSLFLSCSSYLSCSYLCHSHFLSPALFFCMFVFCFFLSICIDIITPLKLLLVIQLLCVFLCLWFEVESEALDAMGVLTKDFLASNIKLRVKGWSSNFESLHLRLHVH